jgi:hypothetical protein
MVIISAEKKRKYAPLYGEFCRKNKAEKLTAVNASIKK